MPTTDGPTALDLGTDSLVHLADDLAITRLPVDPSFWTHSGSAPPELASGRVLCLGDYSETWTRWERHPNGDELVLLLSGDVDLLLEDDSLQTTTLLPGQAVIVPAGTWHRAAVRAPSRMLFITPTPARTQERPV